jgi:hypothetical protein
MRSGFSSLEELNRDLGASIKHLNKLLCEIDDFADNWDSTDVGP